MLRRVTMRSINYQATFKVCSTRMFSKKVTNSQESAEALLDTSQTLKDPKMLNKLQEIEQYKPDMNNLSIFNIETLGKLPPWFKFLDPVVESGKVSPNYLGFCC